jgi:N-acetylmuramoyl-L-alanine amidase
VPPLNAAQAGADVQFGQIMQLAASGIPLSSYVDAGRLNPRADIAGLHLAQFPSVPRARQHDERV